MWTLWAVGIIYPITLAFSTGSYFISLLPPQRFSISHWNTGIVMGSVGQVVGSTAWALSLL